MTRSILEQLLATHGLNDSNIDSDLQSIEQPKAAAERIVTEFSGLHIGSVGPGKDLPTSDVHFYSCLRPEVSGVAEPWAAKTGVLWGIATAHHQHMIILAGDRGRLYAFSDPDEQLYLLGSTFKEAMEHLLMGYNYGPPIAKS